MTRKRTGNSLGPPSSRGAAPLDAETLATLKAEAAKPGMTAEALRKHLDPIVPATTFHRALRGDRMSVPVQKACADLAKTLRNYQRPVEVAYDFDPDPEAA